MSEFRQDIVSGDWILIAPRRHVRPNQFKPSRNKRFTTKDCPFENPIEAGGGVLISSYPQGEDWQLQVVPNKFPAVQYPRQMRPGFVPKAGAHGPYPRLDGVGHHELLITRKHNSIFSTLPEKSADLVFAAFAHRYRALATDKNVAYVAIFQNWGPTAGTSIYHPHYQLITLPIVPPDVEHSISGSKRYFSKNKRCVHCDMIKWELREKKRIVFENSDAVVFAPFASRSPYELRVFPKKHFAYFEDTDKGVVIACVKALQTALTKLGSAVSTSYNFFIHTAPVKNKVTHKHYHWHIEIVPRVLQQGGFEFETGVIINAVDPDEAAKILRKVKERKPRINRTFARHDFAKSHE